MPPRPVVLVGLQVNTKYVSGALPPRLTITPLNCTALSGRSRTTLTMNCYKGDGADRSVLETGRTIIFFHELFLHDNIYPKQLWINNSNGRQTVETVLVIILHGGIHRV